MNPFETWPPGCDFTYECTSVDGPDPDVQCETNDKAGVWKNEFKRFEKFGTYSFVTTNMQKYSPGIYEFTITGILGTQNPVEAKTKFFLELRNPCPTALLTLIDYPLGNIDYYVGDGQINRLFNLQGMV